MSYHDRIKEALIVAVLRSDAETFSFDAALEGLIIIHGTRCCGDEFSIVVDTRCPAKGTTMVVDGKVSKVYGPGDVAVAMSLAA